MAQSRLVRRRRPSQPTDIPAPAIPAGRGPWKVRDMPPGFAHAGQSTNTLATENVLTVPLGQDAESQAIRFHEYAHLELGKLRPQLAAELNKHLRSKTAPLDYTWLQGGLDVVVNALAQKRGITEIADLPLNDPSDAATDESRALWLLRKLSLTGGKLPKSNKLPSEETDLVRSIYSALQSLGAEHAANTAQIGDAQYASYIVQNLQRMQMYFDTKEALRRLKTKPSLAPMTNELMRRAMDGEGLDAGRLNKLFGTDSPFDLTHSGPKPTYRYGAGETKWGKMSIVTLSMDARAKRRAPERQPSYVGGFRNPMRALLPAMDGRAWALRRKRMGGTILLDMSGSMSLDIEDIKKLLRTAPLAQIAGYSGNLTDGTLYIMAKGGRYHSAIPEHPGSNVIDGPALRWLAKQPKPRVWISDGQVTGVGDDMQSNVLADAIAVVQHNDIERYHTIESYLLGNAPTDSESAFEEAYA